MAKYTCNRCGALLNTTTEQAHLCADLARRYARQAAAVDAVKAILLDVYGDEGDATALAIIKALSGRDLGFG